MSYQPEMWYKCSTCGATFEVDEPSDYCACVTAQCEAAKEDADAKACEDANPTQAPDAEVPF
jgi:DNA-directed RNA polymerase subunit RPC12/RpoP